VVMQKLQQPLTPKLVGSGCRHPRG
jgi:hypothetical protein